MGLAAWLTLAVIAGAVVAMATTRLPADGILIAGVIVLLVAGVIDTGQALHGLSNPGVITIAAMYVVSSGIQETGALDALVHRVLGRPRSELGAQARIMVPVAGFSAFFNNTPLVAMLLPVVGDWARRIRLSPSRLLMPLSVASILGGACTLIGTSTNLIVHGWLIGEAGLHGIGLFDVSRIGVPVALAGIAYTLLVGRRLLPDRRPVLDVDEAARQYTVELVVSRGSPLAGRTIEQAGLRHLPGLFLAEIQRGGTVLPAVSGNETLEEGDVLVFVGDLSSVVDLQRMRGLEVPDAQSGKLQVPRTSRVLVEAVVSPRCPLVGRTIREGRFRTVYNAVVVAMARGDERIAGKLGDAVLQAGDVLLLEAPADFVDRHGRGPDFYLVSALPGTRPPNHERAGLALAIVGALILLAATGWTTMLEAALLAAAAMLATGCTQGPAARAAVDLKVLLVIAAALGLGSAIESSGLADVGARSLLGLVGPDPHLALAALIALTSALAAAVTAQTAAVLVLPLSAQLAEVLGVDLLPLAMGVMMAAATTVATPVGYPTQLMASAADLGILAAVLLAERRLARRGRSVPGLLFALYLGLYGAKRFLLEFLRATASPLVAGLTWAQIAALAFVLAAASGAALALRRARA